MDDKQKALCEYRLEHAAERLEVAKNCLDSGHYRASINRSYYSAFYAIKSVLAQGTVDFKRHKDVVAYFNKEYVATDKFDRELGRKLGTLKQIREKSDYDDFFIASKSKAAEQIATAEMLLEEIKEYLKEEQ